MINRRCVLAYLIALCGMLCLLILGYDNEYTELTFSAEPGFYEYPFRLRIYAPKGTEIYYTLDGSVPDENAIKYTEPILINDATANENVYSARTDVTAGFLTEDILACGMEVPGYVVPDYPVDKCTIVRAAYLDADGNFSEVETGNFFVGYQDKAGYDGLNIISIVTEPDNLFDPEDGIYTLGNIYDTYAGEADRSLLPWAWWEANYHQHGREWERNANIQFFDTERMMLLDAECGIRIQGGASRGFLPKSLNIYARKQYDGNGRFYVDLFKSGYMADTVTLFAGGGDSIAKFRDRLAAELVRTRSFGTMNFEPCVMFLNGEYWGVYWLTEKYDDAFAAHYYDVEKDNVIMIKNGELAEGESGDYELYAEMMEYMQNTDFTVDENYEYACELLDMQSLIDYFASEIYFGRYGDWPVSNFALWRTREIEEGQYGDGKWRWLMFDVNSGAFDPNMADQDMIRITMDTSPMFYNLCRNSDFQRQFVISFMDIMNTSFEDERVAAMISDYQIFMEEPMGVHLKRFTGAENSSLFENAIADIRYYMENRKPYMMQFLKNDFGLSGTLVPLEVEISHTDAGKIIVNTAEIAFDDTMVWRGEYYTDYSVTLTAIANEGYRFVRWENAEASEEAAIVVDLNEEGISLKAVFEKTDH